MNNHALRVLEFDKVREIVAPFARSEPGRARVLSLLPDNDTDRVTAGLTEVRELTALLTAGEEPPLVGIRDIGPSVERLGVAALALRPAELLDIASTLAAGRKIKTFFSRFAKGGGTGPVAPLLTGRTGGIVPQQAIEDAIVRAVDESGEVKDGASPGLRRIRKSLARVRDDVLQRMERIFRDESRRDVVQEQVVTMRDDRYVLPLKPNFRQSVKGVVHGQSGSRATLFVEPLDVVEQNNRLAELRVEEREEVERILRALTTLIADERQAIGELFAVVTAVDSIAARARFGLECGGTVPAIADRGRIVLRGARHPLLVWKPRTGPDQRAAVPNDLSLSADRPVLVISGPNAGGKTVILKTVGLLCLMAQAGMPVTAAEGSEVPVLADLFADIGDEQDLGRDLSTFSSHVSGIAGILRDADRDSLVLLDELGSGTDPAEGGAFGSAVLTRLIDRGCITVVTTHHNALKLFGSRTSGAVNAAMEFDPATLEPTYRFVPGRPGRSYGLDMAARLGIPPGVIADARSLLSTDEAGLDRLLQQVEEDALRLRREREQAEADRRSAAALRADAEEKARTAVESAKAVMTKARQDAREVLAGLRRKLKELSRTDALTREAAQSERLAVEALARTLEPPDETAEAPLPVPHAFRPGDRVRLPKLKRTGTVLFVHKNALEVDAGQVKLQVSARDAVPLDGPQRDRPAGGAGWSAELEEREGAVDRVNLLGMRVADAVEAVDRFIDRAGLQGFRQVTVIHGLGTGALKEAVTAFLKGHALVSSLRPGGPAEGGAGVTVAELKE